MEKNEREKILSMLKEVASKFDSLRDAVCAPYGLSSIQAILILDVYHMYCVFKYDQCLIIFLPFMCLIEYVTYLHTCL